MDKKDKEEVGRLYKIRAEIIAEREKLKKEKEDSISNPTKKGELIDSVSIAIHHNGIKLYTMDGRLINTLTWEDLDKMRSETRPDNYLVTEGKASPQVLFRETFQNFLEFCNTLYLPPEIENIPKDAVNNPSIDPNTRAFIDMVIHYEEYFEKNEQWKKPFTRFLKWICFLFKEDHLIRERLGWIVWWWVVKHGNKLLIWEPMYDPKHWSPYGDGEIVRDVEGPRIANPLTEEEQKEVIRKNEEMMRNGRQGAT